MQHSILSISVLFAALLFLLAKRIRPKLEGHSFGKSLLARWMRLRCHLGLRQSFVVPDIVSHCPYPVRCNPHCEEQSRASVLWLAELTDLTKKGQNYYTAVKLGELMSRVNPFADAERLRIAIDWMNYVFRLDDWIEEMDVEGNMRIEECCVAAMRDPINYQTDEPAAILTKSWCSRFEEASNTACKNRMIETMQGYFKGVREQVAHRAKGHVPNMEDYIAIRRLSSGVTPCFVITEMCGGYHLPDDVFNDPVIHSLREAAVEHVFSVNDLVSFDKEEGRGDYHNLVSVIMKTKGLGLQEAVDMVGRRINDCVDRFERLRKQLPSWGPEIDKNVTDYLAGQEHWMSGHLYWAFSSGRYFGNQGSDFKNNRFVKLREVWPSMTAEIS